MSSLHSGDLFANRFEIDRAAGSGGMGTVYRARDRFSGDTVALKLLHAQFGNADEAERFAREAQLLSELRHPGIVSYVAHGQTSDGQRFLAMEWLEGEDLAQRLRRGPVALHEALLMLRRAAEALALAHQRGVIHRDLKPTNLFLPYGELERVKLLDFGIARRLATSKGMTRTGLVIGTPEYMSPEQARGSRDLTPAADVFSLGCVLYECLTGEPPFVAEHIAAVLVRILFEEPAPLSERRPGVPPSVSELLLRTLAKDPAHRFADAWVLSAALTALDDLPELPMLPTLAAPARAPTLFADSEQVLFSLVIAASSQAADLGNSTVQSVDALAEAEHRVALLAALRPFGVHADYLASGALLIRIPQASSATDQATLAARVGLLVRERWPEAAVAVVTGRGTVKGISTVGEVADRAARLIAQQTEEKDQSQTQGISGVWLDKLTARLLGPGFAVTKLDEGVVVIGEEREADASRPLLGKPTLCVGREGELATLEAQLTSCIEDCEARVALITAAPGLGKSRLRHELLRRFEQKSVKLTLLFGQGDLMSAGAPHGILGQALRRLCGLSGGESLADQLSGLQNRLKQHIHPAEQQRVIEFLGELSGVPFPDAHSPALRVARQDPKIMQSQIRRAFLDWLTGECKAAPVLLIFDDLHWGDSLTVGLLDHALRALAASPLFILALARPAVHEIFPKLWQGHKVQEIALKGLGKRACERLIVQALGTQLDPAITSRLIDQSAGNALYLEELIRAAAEGTEESQPETVLAMLQARIGRLDPGVRRLLRVASIYGQTFWRGGVEALLGTERGGMDLDRWLQITIDEEITEESPESRLSNEKEYRFRHTLMREAAYGLLAESDLSIGHYRAGLFLENAGEPDPMIVAEHYQRAGEPNRALKFYILGAEQAFDAYALVSALHRVECGIASDAQGSELGVLRSMQCVLFQWANCTDLGLRAGIEALSLLTPGSSYWCTALQWLISGSSGAPPEWQARFPEFVALVSNTDPEPDARAAYAATLAYLVSTFVWIGQLEPAQVFFNRLKTIGATAAKADPTIERWIYQAECSIVRYFQPNIWGSLQLSEQGIISAQHAGDVFTQLLLQYYHGMTLYELGALDMAEHSFRTQRVTPDLTQDHVMFSLISQCLAFILSHHNDIDKLAEASSFASEVVRHTGANLWIIGAAQDSLARVKLKQGNSAEAESIARKAYVSLNFAPAYGLVASVTLIYSLLAQGRAQDAIEVAENGLQRIQQVGCAGYNEVAMRLAASEAFHASGAVERGRVELRATLHQIRYRADGITDPFWKNSYLTRNLDNIRARQLAHDWNLSDGPTF